MCFEPARNNIKVVKKFRKEAAMKRYGDPMVEEKEDDLYLKILMLVLCIRVSAITL